MKIQVVIEATSIQEYTEAIQALAAGYTVQAPTINVIAGTEESAKTVDSDAVQESKPAEVKYISAKVAKRLDNKVGSLAEIDNVRATRLFDKYDIDSTKGIKADDVKNFEEDLNSLLERAKNLKEQNEADEKEAVEDAKQQQKETEEAEKQVDKLVEESTEPKHGFPAVKAIAMKLNKIQDGKAEVKFLLEKFGAAKLSEIKEENYDEFHELASKAIADHDNAPAKEDKPSDDSASESNGEAEVTLEMIRSKAKEVSVAGYKEEIKAELKKIGAPSLTKIPKDQYAAFYEAMENIG